VADLLNVQDLYDSIPHVLTTEEYHATTLQARQSSFVDRNHSRHKEDHQRQNNQYSYHNACCTSHRERSDPEMLP